MFRFQGFIRDVEILRCERRVEGFLRPIKRLIYRWFHKREPAHPAISVGAGRICAGREPHFFDKQRAFINSQPFAFGPP
jgi:hypothetical protein